MEKINFRDLKSLIEVFSNAETQRTILSIHQNDKFIWRGQSGFLTKVTILFDFQKKYLEGIKTFEETYQLISDLLKEIPSNEYENQIISLVKHKKTLFNILNIISRLEQEILHHYSVNTLFQFSNITFNSDILFTDIESVFEAETWAFIPDSAKNDIVEGGRALLFNLPTSASFMFLRSLEDCIRKLSNQVNGNKKQETFGQAIQSIQNNKDKFQNEKADFDRQLGFLKYIKDEFRNPSAHPDKTFSQKEAEQLFQVVNVAIDKLKSLYENVK